MFDVRGGRAQWWSFDVLHKGKKNIRLDKAADKTIQDMTKT